VEPEKLELTTVDIAAEKQAELLRLFPEVRTEGGKIDFERLRLALGETVDVGKERYGMNWPGKADCFRAIQRPSLGTLLPVRDESVYFDETENLIIEGDNLEVLKLLQKSYQGKVKMIYIDPPYNTGNDFIYPDNYSESLQTYLEFTGQIDSEGRKFSNNVESDGRFHSKWMNMMYPRLYLARNLLRDDGIIFVSIGDDEQSNLRGLLNAIFGEENFCAVFVWNTEGNTDNQYAVKVKHEYIIAYFRDASKSEQAIGRIIDPNTREDSNLWKGIADNNINKNNPENPPEVFTLPIGFPCEDETLFYEKKVVDDEFFKKTSEDKYVSDGIKEKYNIEKISGLPVKLDDMIVKDYKLVAPCRIFGGVANRNKLAEFVKNGCSPIQDDGSPLRFYINSNAAVRYQRQNEKPRNIISVLRNMGTTERARGLLKQQGIDYDYPKPVPLISYLVKIGCEVEDGVVLDFFAGSGTTAEAVLDVNKESNGRRSYILVQLPESTRVQKSDGSWVESAASKAGFKTLSEITIQRVRKLSAASTNGKFEFAGKGADGFRLFRLASSNFAIWSASTENSNETSLGQQIELHINHILPKRSSDDLLHEILLKSGFPLATPIQSITIEGISVYSVANGAMLICLERTLTHEAIKGMAELKPERVVCLDEGFAGNDQLKTNAVLIMKAKGVTKFQTV
jgi:adenine-specific DNA-methyltransferase